MIETIIQNTINLDRRFWSENRQTILRTCLVFADESMVINADAVDKITSAIQGNRKTVGRTKLKRLESVLSRLNEMGVVDSVVPSVPCKLPRPSFLPANAEDASQLDGAIFIVDHMWNSWIYTYLGSDSSPQRMHQALAFMFAVSCTADGAIGPRIVSNILLSLRPHDTQNDGSIRVRTYPDKDVQQHCSITLPSSALLLLKIIKSKQPNKKKNQHIFFSTTEGTETRRKRIHAEMKRLFKELKKSCVSEPDCPSLPQTWSQFRALARIQPILDGMEPFIATVLHDYPLPAAHPSSSKLKLKENERSTPLGVPTRKMSIELPNSGVDTVDLEKAFRSTKRYIEEDWCGRSKKILRQLIHFVKYLTERKTESQIMIGKTIEKIDKLTRQADQIAPPTSALHLALNWIKDFIVSHGTLSPRTIEEYLSRVFLNGLLCDPESYDLSLWEAEDHELAFEETISRESLKHASTKKGIHSTYKQTYEFAITHGFCCSVDLSFVANEWIGGSRRNEIIGLYEFDTFISLVLNDETRDNLQLAVVCILAFYGGMRAGEISRLTLNDLVICDGHLYVDVLRGKTSAARREIPLHLLAPANACSIVTRLYQGRREEFPVNAHLYKIPLFGPERSRERYGSRVLANEAIKQLKGFFGESLTLHHLRHSFASWVFVRMYASKYPDLIDELAESTHELFSRSYLARTSYLMSGDVTGQITEHEGTSLIRFSKLIGHLGPKTLFSTYIHTFDIIQAHAMRRVDRIHGSNRKLNGKTIAALIPKMKSRATQAKLKEKTIHHILLKIQGE